MKPPTKLIKFNQFSSPCKKQSPEGKQEQEPQPACRVIGTRHINNTASIILTAGQADHMPIVAGQRK